MDTMPGLRGDVWYFIDGQEIMNGNSCISFHICEEVSETVREDVWRLGDDKKYNMVYTVDLYSESDYCRNCRK